MRDFEASREELIETTAERDAFYWKGQKLEPFSFGRQAAAQRVMKQDASNLENAVLLVYLCTLSPEEIDAVRGPKETTAFRLRMADWSQKEGISLRNDQGIIETSNQIWDELDASRFELAKEVSKGGKTDAPPPNE